MKSKVKFAACCILNANIMMTTTCIAALLLLGTFVVASGEGLILTLEDGASVHDYGRLARPVVVQQSIVCTNMGNDGHKNNCNSCDSWRMYAFQDGAEDQSAGDDAVGTRQKQVLCMEVTHHADQGIILSSAENGPSRQHRQRRHLQPVHRLEIQRKSTASTKMALPVSIIPGKNLTRVDIVCAPALSPEACYETVDHEGDEVCAWGNEDGCVAATTKIAKTSHLRVYACSRLCVQEWNEVLRFFVRAAMRVRRVQYRRSNIVVGSLGRHR